MDNGINILVVSIIVLLNTMEYLKYKKEKINRNTNRRQLTAKSQQPKTKNK